MAQWAMENNMYAKHILDYRILSYLYEDSNRNLKTS